MGMKMKGLFKGLRYISQIFEEEEEKEMQIGFPTDVKHVAHIGWDGPSVNSPSWMNEFKSPAPGNASVPPQLNGDANKELLQDSSNKKSTRETQSRDLPTLPKSSRRKSSMDSIGSTESPLGSPTQKSKSTRRRQSKQKESSTSSPKGPRPDSSNSQAQAQAQAQGQSLPNIPKKTRRKKSKDGEGSSTSSRSKEKGSKHGSRNGGSDEGSISKEYGREAYPTSGLVTLKEEEVKV